MAVSLVSLAVLTWQNPDETVATRWKYYAITGFVIAQVAWYEIVFIFPINDEIRAMNTKFEGKEDQSLPETDHKRLISLLEKWQLLHWGRILLPLVGSIISLASIL